MKGDVILNYNLHKQDILCPDCGINYIDEDRYKNYRYKANGYKCKEPNNV